MSTNLGDLIRRHRQAAKITLTQLAALVGLRSSGDVSNRERGTRGETFVPSLWLPLVNAIPGLTLDEIIAASERDREADGFKRTRLRRNNSDQVQIAEAMLLLREICEEPHGKMIPMLRGLLAMKRAAENMRKV